MNILFTWKYRQKFLYVDCTLTKKESNRYDTRVTVQNDDKFGDSLFAFEIQNILGKQQYKFFHGSPDSEMLKDISEVILNQFDIIRICHLN
jgi:hypothetical protein